MAEPKKKSRSEQRHLDDLDIGKYHFSQGGKSCLNRHVGKYSVGDACSHRWHARAMGLTLMKKELGRKEQNLYQWPADARRQPPHGTSWDLDGANFTDSASVPYSFEAHHVVPTNELMNAINSVGKTSPMKLEIVTLVRKGLMEEEYNLNDKVNMLILPMERDESFALALPKHKVTVQQPNHYRYSNYVRQRLDKLFRHMKKDVDKHEEEAKESDKAAKSSAKEATRSDTEANRQQHLMKDHEKKGWEGRAAMHREREATSRNQTQAQWEATKTQKEAAQAQRQEALAKVQASARTPPSGMGKQGIENLSRSLRGKIIEAGLVMKARGLDSSLDDLESLLKKIAKPG
ncbi:AHH domain-containing protein [Corallococcus terminator]